MTGPRSNGANVSRRSFLRTLAFGVLGAGLPGTTFGAEEEVARVWRAMGTLIEVRVQGLPNSDAVEAIAGVRTRLEAVEDALTTYRSHAVLSRLASEPVGGWIPAPEILIESLQRSDRAWRESGGVFDPTVAAMMRMWGLDKLDAQTPDPEQWSRWRQRKGWSALEVDVAERRIRRHEPELEIDLGGIGKGIGLDACVAALRDFGAGNALLNFGGSIAVTGPPAADPRGWQVGIAHPRAPERPWKVVRLASGQLATSGDSERFVDTPDGRRHHLLDPQSGEPTAGTAAVTVWSPSGAQADIASTVSFVDPSNRLVRDVPQLCLAEDSDGNVFERDSRVRLGETLRGTL